MPDKDIELYKAEVNDLMHYIVKIVEDTGSRELAIHSSFAMMRTIMRIWSMDKDNAASNQRR